MQKIIDPKLLRNISPKIKSLRDPREFRENFIVKTEDLDEFTVDCIYFLAAYLGQEITIFNPKRGPWYAK